MLILPSTLRVRVYLPAVDLRRSFDGLESLVRSEMGEDPLSGGLFVFLNRRRDRTKLLYWDGTGWWIWYKRLEAGTFALPESSGVLQASDLMLLLEGIDLAGSRRRKRFRMLAKR
jgi:transposase